MRDEWAFDAVCVGAHPDDVEIGMGGTVARLTQAGLRVAIIDLTNGEPTPHGSVEIRRRESAEAADILGVSERRTLSQPNRYLMDTVEARNELAEVLRELRPRMLFVPYASDAHPDHIAASSICLAARFYAKLTKTGLAGEPYYPPRVLRYMAVHLNVIDNPTFICDCTDTLERKLHALRAYASQFSANPANTAVIEQMELTAKMWGRYARVGAGEPFFALEPIALNLPTDIL